MTEAPPAEPGRLWTLQRRLIVTVLGITSLVMVMVAVATSAILGSVLEGQLNAQLDALTQRTVAARPLIIGGLSAPQVLQQQPQPPGTLLALETLPGQPTGAVVDGGSIVPLTEDQLVTELAVGLQSRGPHVVTIEGVGTYRVEAFPLGVSVVVVGVSRADTTATIAQMLTTIGLLTAGGLLVLAAATAWTIRAGLAPLRAVADTADRVSRLPLDAGEVSLTERVPPHESDPRSEVGRVGAALNSLLDHVGASLQSRQRNEERMRSFVADASHELRTPLASIRGYSELSLGALRADGSATALTEQSLERIHAQSLRMTTLVEDLLLLARLDEGQELVFATVDLTRLAIDAINDARAAGGDHVWKLEVDEEPVVLAGDAARLQQVAANLLANARVHTPAGTTVTVSVRRDDEGAVLRIHDDGPGIDPALGAELFSRFSRGDRSRARSSGGTGLGLSIAKAIVDAHGGDIRVDSRPGDTTFEVRLAARPAVLPVDPVSSR